MTLGIEVRHYTTCGTCGMLAFETKTASDRFTGRWAHVNELGQAHLVLVQEIDELPRDVDR